MNRRKARETAFIILFSTSFADQSADEVVAAFCETEDVTPDAFCNSLIYGYIENAAFIDQKITENLREWKMERISKVSLSVLRVALTEMFFADDNPQSVIVNEAVELAKTFGDYTDYQFVNGLLSTIIKQESR